MSDVPLLYTCKHSDSTSSVSTASISTAPLAVLLHGKGGNLNVMQPFENAIPSGHSVVRIQAPFVDSEIGGYVWWQFSPQSELDLAIQVSMEASIAKEKVLATLQYIFEKENLLPLEVYCVGFSQGAAISSILLQQNILPISRAAMLCGFFLEDALGSRNSQDVFWFHGDDDTTVPIGRAKRDVEKMRQLGHGVTFVTDPVGHKISSRGMRELKSWLATRKGIEQ